MLKVKDLNVYYGSIHALHDISFHVNQGEVLSLIGANGAGKTTILHAVSRMIPAKSGEITFEDQSIVNLAPHKIITMGMSHVPEGRRIFANLTVKDNLKLGAYTRKDKDEIVKDRKMVYDRFPRLRERKNQLAGTLSGGEQQMLAMGRALMCRPKMILMDEPSMGLSPILVKEIFSIIKDVSQSGVTICLVEQNAKMALSISNRAYVIETGRIVMEGDSKELLENEGVKKAYLGHV